MPDQLAVEAKGLRKTYGKLEAVTDPSFSLQPGEIVGFLGLNGAGKTSLLSIQVC